MAAAAGKAKAKKRESRRQRDMGAASGEVTPENEIEEDDPQEDDCVAPLPATRIWIRNGFTALGTNPLPRPSSMQDHQACKTIKHARPSIMQDHQRARSI